MIVQDGQRGSAMVLAIGVLAVIAVMAIVIVAIVISEKRTSASAYTQDRAFYSADAATEAGSNWLLNQLSPAATVDSVNTVLPSQTGIVLGTDRSFTYGISYVSRRFRPGWSAEYKDYVYNVQGTGTSVQQSQAKLQVNASRLYREGY
jgi:Tfp pilus assembly protein PilX